MLKESGSVLINDLNQLRIKEVTSFLKDNITAVIVE